jgi:hypothetical protein
LAEWSSRVTGSLSAILIFLGLGISVAGAFGAKIPADSIVQLATWLLAAICGGQAAYSVWGRERQARSEAEERVAEAEERLKPKLRAIYDPTKWPCYSVSTFSDGTTSSDGMVFRLEVENLGEEQITDCEGYLTEIAFEGESAEMGVMNLTWADMPSPSIKVNLLRGVKRNLDILVIYQTGQVRILSPTSYGR